MGQEKERITDYPRPVNIKELFNFGYFYALVIKEIPHVDPQQPLLPGSITMSNWPQSDRGVITLDAELITRCVVLESLTKRSLFLSRDGKIFPLAELTMKDGTVLLVRLISLGSHGKKTDPLPRVMEFSSSQFRVAGSLHQFPIPVGFIAVNIGGDLKFTEFGPRAGFFNIIVPGNTNLMVGTYIGPLYLRDGKAIHGSRGGT